MYRNWQFIISEVKYTAPPNQ